MFGVGINGPRPTRAILGPAHTFRAMATARDWGLQTGRLVTNTVFHLCLLAPSFAFLLVSFYVRFLFLMFRFLYWTLNLVELSFSLVFAPHLHSPLWKGWQHALISILPFAPATCKMLGNQGRKILLQAGNLVLLIGHHSKSGTLILIIAAVMAVLQPVFLFFLIA